MNSNSYTFDSIGLLGGELVGSASVSCVIGSRVVEKRFYFSNEAEFLNTIFSLIANVYQHINRCHVAPGAGESIENPVVSLCWRMKADQKRSSLIQVIGGTAMHSFEWTVRPDSYEYWKNALLSLAYEHDGSHVIEK